MKKTVFLAGLLEAASPAIAATAVTTQPVNLNPEPLTKITKNTLAKRYIVMFANDAITSTQTHSAKTSQTSVFGKSGFSTSRASSLIERHGGTVKRHLQSISAMAAELTPARRP